MGDCNPLAFRGHYSDTHTHPPILNIHSQWYPHPSTHTQIHTHTHRNTYREKNTHKGSCTHTHLHLNTIYTIYIHTHSPPRAIQNTDIHVYNQINKNMNIHTVTRTNTYTPPFVFAFFGRDSIFLRSSATCRDSLSPSLPPYKLKCVVWGKVQQQGFTEKYQIRGEARVQQLLASARFLQDDVYTRTCDLPSAKNILSADLF